MAAADISLWRAPFRHMTRNPAISLIVALFLVVYFKYSTTGNPQDVVESTLPSTVPPIEQILRNVTISTAAQKLPNKGSIFCFVTTTKKYHKARAQAVAETWLPRCDHGELFTNSSDHLSPSTPYRTIYRNLNDTYGQLFWKTKLSIHYVYKYISSDFDWYLKADDDTFIIVENLRAYLSTLDPTKPHYIGFRMKPYLKKGYNSGGAGYVLSREAMRIFSEELYENNTLCPFSDFEDVGIGSCLSRAGIYPEVTVDREGRQRFLPYDFPQVFRGMLDESGADYWFVEKPKKGYDAFSPELISIHHLNADQIRMLEISLYRLRVAKRWTKRRQSI
ncbi:hypothetical protein QR680_007868 [Steinernema hermaphroditum]|uniref:N-acetylgalactosaminide beta-1,3-galactosyltransferase n=1 Tax=Steinernema hermaphroditum TaxID=289476 RepID=A0AA39IGY1_9BILA|nr:hypothetical protein QR680_007868 [Steinernema hermaphroditum]